MVTNPTDKIAKTLFLQSNILLDKDRLAENLQKECLCYFIIFFTPPWRKHFNHILNQYNLFAFSTSPWLLLHINKPCLRFSLRAASLPQMRTLRVCNKGHAPGDGICMLTATRRTMRQPTLHMPWESFTLLRDSVRCKKASHRYTDIYYSK